MKSAFKKLAILLLKKRADIILKNKNVQIYGITGSVGKTTTKEALTAILSLKYKVISSKGGFNTPIGLLLSVLGEESGFSSPFRWLWIFIKVYTKKITIPDILVLEYGVDQKGDMDELLKIARPNKAILTKIAPVHMAEGQFESLGEIAEEKAKLIEAANEVILNKDCIYLQAIRGKKETIYFTGKTAQDEKNGFSFEYGGVRYFVPIFGSFLYSSFMPAVIFGLKAGIKSEKIKKVLAEMQAPAGRGRVLMGINNSIIWDSSYNASPEAVKKMLETMKKIPAKRKLALLGNMNELGEKSTEFHQEIGKIAANKVDMIFFVGEKLNEEAFYKGVNRKKPLTFFKDANEAGRELAKILKKGDLLLVKGSQNRVRLEKAVKKLLKDSGDQCKLCRQGSAWENI